MSRVTAALVVGAMLVALTVGVALAWMVQAGALTWTIYCNAGNGRLGPCRATDNPDRIVESSANDYVLAGKGDDTVDAARFGGDTDVVDGGSGDDTINAADGDPLDTIICGKGRHDVAIFDPGDKVAADCEDTTATTTGGPVPTVGGR